MLMEQRPEFIDLHQKIEQEKALLEAKTKETQEKAASIKDSAPPKLEIEIPPVKEPEPDEFYEAMDEVQIDTPPAPENYEDGFYEEYYKDSTLLRWAFTIKDKQFEGKIYNFYPLQDIIKRTYTLVNGVMEGLDIHYFPNGGVYMEMTYVGGIINGILKMYRAGRIATEAEMVDGKLGSYMKNYHDNGNLGVLIRYKDGKMDGIMETYSEDGFLQGKTYYVADLKHGPDIVYYQDGSIQSETNYIDDLQDGDAKDYYPNGILMQVEKFSKGVSITHAKIYDHEGRLLSVD